FYGEIHSKPVFAANHTIFSRDLDHGPVLRARRYGYGAHGSRGEIKSHDSMRFDPAGSRVGVCERSNGGDPRGFAAAENIAQRIEAMDADVADWTSERDVRVVNPLAGAAGRGVGELRLGKLRLADAAFGDPVAHEIEATVVAHVLGHAQTDIGALRGGKHLVDFLGVHGQGLFAQNVLAMLRREQNVFEVQHVGRDDEDRVNVGRGAEFGGRAEDVRDRVFARVRLGFGGVAPPEAGDLGGGGSAEARHKATNRMVAEPENAEANHDPPSLLGAVSEDVFGVVIHDLRLVLKHFDVVVLKELRAGVAQLLADGLLDAGIVQL